MSPLFRVNTSAILQNWCVNPPLLAGLELLTGTQWTAVPNSLFSRLKWWNTTAAFNNMKYKKKWLVTMIYRLSKILQHHMLWLPLATSIKDGMNPWCGGSICKYTLFVSLSEPSISVLADELPHTSKKVTSWFRIPYAVRVQKFCSMKPVPVHVKTEETPLTSRLHFIIIMF